MLKSTKLIRSFQTILMVVVVFILVLISQNAFAADGTPYNGPHNMPGVIQAEDFNDGGQYVSYYATTSGNQGGWNYRTGVDVDLYSNSSGNYIMSSAGYSTVREYVKFTFQVSTTGWYKITYRARKNTGNSSSLVTLIDERQLGVSDSVPVQSSFTDVNGPQCIYLATGTHVLHIGIPDGSTCIDSITFTSISAPNFQNPAIVSTSQTTEEIVVADAVVTGAPYYADATGVADSTAAIQAALNDVGKLGGGTVFIPSGIYRLDGALYVPNNVTLRGDWKSPLEGGSGQGTILKASVSRDNESGTPFINLNGVNSCVRNLGVWYPDQHYSSATIHKYPYSIACSNVWGVSVMNITLYNSYNGISIGSGSASLIGNVYGTVLSRGIYTYGGWEYPFMYNVSLENSIWKNSPTSIVSNAPTSTPDRNALDNFTSLNLIGVQLGQNDAHEIYGVSVKNAKSDIVVKKGPGDDHAFYGAMSKIDGDIEIVDTYPNLHFINTDKVPETGTLSYTFSTLRKPANTTNFYNVKLAPYNAAGNGITDDTAAIQSALNAAGSAGGGTVYLPQGQYRVNTRLSVPAGVELRGPYGGPHGAEILDTCVLLAYEGKNTSNPDGAQAFITLAANAGVRGFTIVYPEQGIGSTSQPVYAYPYTIRGNGSGIWAVDMNLTNSYNAVNLIDNTCNNYLVTRLWACALNWGITVGGGSNGGKIEMCTITYGNWLQTYRTNAPHEYGKDILKNYTNSHTCAFVFGNCTNQSSFGANSHFVFAHWRSITQGGSSCTNSTFWQPSSDTSGYVGYMFEGGNNLKFIGLAAGGCASNWLRATSAFTGTAYIYDKYLWANQSGPSINGGNVLFYNEASPVNLAAGRSASMDATPFYGCGADKSVDGNISTYTQASTKVDWDLTVDMGGKITFDSVIFKPDNQNYATSYSIQVSDNGIDWAIVATEYAGNGTEKTYNFAAVNKRYIKLNVTASIGTFAHAVKEFEVYNSVGNYALLCSASMNATPYYGCEANKSTDGNAATYAQANSKVDWDLTVDLGRSMSFKRVVVKPDASNYASVYTIEVSDDNINWVVVAIENYGNGQNKEYTFIEVNKRYIKLNVAASYGSYGHAVKELEVYAN